jgi:hypothetical protein
MLEAANFIGQFAQYDHEVMFQEVRDQIIPFSQWKEFI